MAKFILSAFADEAAESLEMQIKALKENGIGYIEPRFIDKKGIITLSDEELYEVRRALDEGGIKVGSLGSPIGKFGIDEDFSEQLEKLQRALRAAEILGAERIRMFSFYIPRDTRREYLPEISRRLGEFIRLADEKGIRLCHENEEKIFGESPEDVTELFESIPGLYGIFDPANYCVCGYDPIEGLTATLPRLEYVHIKDGKMKGSPGTENGMIILPAGKGDGKLAEALDIIDKHTDGTVMLTLEPHLYASDAFRGVDDRTLAAGLNFENERAAFDAGASALRTLLCDCGYILRNGAYEKI